LRKINITQYEPGTSSPPVKTGKAALREHLLIRVRACSRPALQKKIPNKNTGKHKELKNNQQQVLTHYSTSVEAGSVFFTMFAGIWE